MRLFAALQQHDSFHGIVIMIHADLAQPRLRGFMHVRHVAQIDRHTIALVISTFCMSSMRLQQADAANIHALAAHRQIVSAGVRVACGDGGDHLRERDVELQQLARVDFGDVFARGAAEPGDVDDPGNLLDFARDEPILRGFQFVQAVIRPSSR